MRILLAVILNGLFFTLAQATPADDQFRALYQREWAWRLKESPQFATAVGVHDYDDQLGHVDVRSQAARGDFLRQVLKELKAIDVNGLSDAERVNYAIYSAQLGDSLAGAELGSWLMPMNSDSSFYADLPTLAESHPAQTRKDVENYIARLRAVPAYFDEYIGVLREAIKRHMTLPRVVLQGRDAPIRTIAEATDPDVTPFNDMVARLPTNLTAAEREELRGGIHRAIAEAVIPAYRKLLQFYTKDYLPHTRNSIAAYGLPNGKAWYRAQIHEYTTLDLSPEEIHAIGLAEVARIRAEMEQVMHDAKFDGDFAAFLTFLRTDPQFYAKTPRELLMHASYIAKRIDGELPKFFAQLPRLPYGVAPVPAAIAPYYTTGRYSPAPEGGRNAGFYWVNTWKLEARPLYALPALTLHEAVPGHHLQGALANEQGEQPPFRRYSYISAYGEGWALYAEHLGVEMGIYETPYEQFGRLTYEMWRACRLVVDTGMHAMGWTREQALALLRDNTALSEHEITTEVDRYISWPGQALSYKLGELKIRELRAKAEHDLGAKFDLRAFHDVVLAIGSVPLPLLQQHVERWIAAQKNP
ncbi:MAG: DUF885 domain-containing protein [Tahibacter sp.]